MSIVKFVKKEAKANEVGTILRKISEEGCNSITWTDLVYKDGKYECDAYSCLERRGLANAGFVPAE